MVSTSIRRGALVGGSALLLWGCGLVGDVDERRLALDPPSPLDLLYHDLAVEIESIKPCYLIGPDVGSVAGLNAPGTRAAFTRSSCFFRVAVNRRDPDLCRPVRSVGTLWHSGADLGASRCRELAAGHGPRYLSGFAQSEGVGPLLTVLGFSDAERTALLADAAASACVLHGRVLFERLDHAPGAASPAEREVMRAMPWQGSRRACPRPALPRSPASQRLHRRGTTPARRRSHGQAWRPARMRDTRASRAVRPCTG